MLCQYQQHSLSIIELCGTNKWFFFLGFSWSGPKAFDVSQENFHVSTTNALGAIKSSVGLFRALQHRQVSSDVTTNEDYLKKLAQLNERIKKIEQLKKLKVTSREVGRLYFVY